MIWKQIGQIGRINEILSAFFKFSFNFNLILKEDINSLMINVSLFQVDIHILRLNSKSRKNQYAISFRYASGYYIDTFFYKVSKFGGRLKVCALKPKSNVSLIQKEDINYFKPLYMIHNKDIQGGRVFPRSLVSQA